MKIRQPFEPIEQIEPFELFIVNFCGRGLSFNFQAFFYRF
jgi:hypothetical protein